jgi:hypothetical protein
VDGGIFHFPPATRLALLTVYAADAIRFRQLFSCKYFTVFVVVVGFLSDPLLECHVGVAPVGPHLVGALRDQVVHLSSQPLARRTGS